MCGSDVQRALDGDHRGAAGRDGVDDLGAVDALGVDRESVGDPPIVYPESPQHPSAIAAPLGPPDHANRGYRIVQAADDARRRIERDLHDGAQQRLIGIVLSLRLVARSAEPATAAAIEGCIEDLRTALAELRELARGLHPVVLSERGLLAALQMLAARSPVPVVVNGQLDGRLASPQEAAVYFVAAEALTNVAKYADASGVQITLHGDERWAEITIADDGVGGARTEPGGGLRGLCDRVEALGGHLTLADAAGAGTTVRARVPVATERPAVITRLA